MKFKCKNSLIVKNIFLFQTILFSQTVLIQLIQFSTDFVYTVNCQISFMLNNSI